MATHAMGRRNTLQVYDDMLDRRGEGEPRPSIPDVVLETKKNKSGWISKKASQIWVSISLIVIFELTLLFLIYIIHLVMIA